MLIWRPKTAFQAKKEGDWFVLMNELEALLLPEDVDAWWTDYLLNRARDLPTYWTDDLRDACQERRDAMAAIEKHRALDAEYRAIV